MLTALLGASAAGAERAEPLVPYQVRPGDTLLALSGSYMLQRDDYRVVQTINKVSDPYRIPIGTTLLFPPDRLRTEPVNGVISAFRGSVNVDGKPVALGMKILQGMRIETGANAFVTIQLGDGSAIALPSQSRILVQKLRRILLTGGLDRTFRLEAGRSRSTVTPIRDPGSSFRVTTPLSVSAVRGTDFRVALDPADGRALTEVVGGTVGVQADADKVETAVPKAYGIISTTEGSGAPIALLPPPRLLQIGRTADGVMITAEAIDGAQRYRSQLASDVAFLDIFDEKVSDTPTVSYTLSPSTTFFLRLTAIAPSGLEGLPATYAFESRVSMGEEAPDASGQPAAGRWRQTR